MADSGPSKKRKFIQKGIFYAELNDFLRTELEQDMSQEGYSIGYSGVEVRNAQSRLEVIIRATRTTHVVGPKGRRIRELASLVKKRFKIPGDQEVELFAERVAHRALCALAQAEAVKFKLMEGLAVRRACYRALRFIMENEAKGCEIIVSGKLRGQRAKAMKFKQGYMITSGENIKHYIDSAVKHVKLRQGVLGIKVKIMLPHDPEGKGMGPKIGMADKVIIHPARKPAWEMAPHELKKGYAQEDPEPAFEEQALDGQDPAAGDYPAADPAMEQGATMGGYEMGAEQGYGQPAEQAYGQPAEQVYGQPEAAYQQPMAQETPGGPNQYPQY